MGEHIVLVYLVVCLFVFLAGICRFYCRRWRTDLSAGIYDCGTACTYGNCDK